MVCRVAMAPPVVLVAGAWVVAVATVLGVYPRILESTTVETLAVPPLACPLSLFHRLPSKKIIAFSSDIGGFGTGRCYR